MVRRKEIIVNAPIAELLILSLTPRQVHHAIECSPSSIIVQIARISIKAKAGIELIEKSEHTALFTATPADKASHMEYFCAANNLDFTGIMHYLGFKRGPMGWATNLPAEEIAYNIDSVFRHYTKNGLVTKREVPLKGLTMSMKTVPLNEQQQSKYDSLVEQMIAAVESSPPRGRGLLKARWLMRTRSFLEESKIEHAANAIGEAVKNKRQVVLFATRVNDTMIKSTKEGVEHDIRLSEGTLRGLQKRLGAKGIPFVSVFGGSKTAVQDVKKFQRGEAKVILTTPQSGGTGLSLDDQTGNSPRTMVMMTPPFSAVDYVQMLGRVHRLKTKSESQAVLISTNTMVDQWNKNIVGNKLNILGASVKGDYSSLSVEDLEVAEKLTPEDAAAFLEKKRKDASVVVKGPKTFSPLGFMKSVVTRLCMYVRAR